MEKIDIRINKVLKDFFGFQKFKGNQREAINSILQNKDTFVIMPTGGGKSLCYQLPALVIDGMAIIISPLIALMKNQVDAIRSYANNDDIVHFLNSSLNKRELERVKECIEKKITKLLFIAPETMGKETTIDFLKNIKISFFAIDEAHCISEWGHDFRPEYRRLCTIIKNIGRKPIIALTATATKKVQNDIVKNLRLSNYNFFISSFNRKNLNYDIRTNLNQDKEIVKFIKHHKHKSGIIYCLSRKKAEEISEFLNLNNIKSLPYHAGLELNLRKKTQDDFLMENVDVIVATIAFGMGIDKPDVRYVIHYNLPKSLENYYQETGRAGRDGGEGNCILFYNKEDVDKFQNFYSKKSVSEKEISMELLEEIVAYVESGDCRRKKILHYFGEQYKESDCNQKCDNCKNSAQLENVEKECLVILNTITESDGLFDTDDITNIIQGKKSKIKNYEVGKLSSFKSGEALNSFKIKQIIRKSIVENFIKKDISTYGKLNITPTGDLFIKSPKPFYIKIKNSEKTTSAKTSVSFDKTLVKLLKEMRREISIEKNIPPFIILQDPSIEDMAKHYPTTMDDLKKITGVGQGKADKFGDRFIKIIKKYVEANNIEYPQDYIIKSKPKKNDLKIFIIQSADKRMPFEDILEQKNIDMETLIYEIENIVNAGTKINIDYHINDILEEEQQKEIFDYFINEADNDSIEEAEKYFEEEYEEQEIRLMKVKIFSDLAN